MNENFDEDNDRPLFLPLSRTKQFRTLLLLVLGTFAFIVTLFFGLGYLVGSL